MGGFKFQGPTLPEEDEEENGKKDEDQEEKGEGKEDENAEGGGAGNCEGSNEVSKILCQIKGIFSWK
jgi:hypothetical protein